MTIQTQGPQIQVRIPRRVLIGYLAALGAGVSYGAAQTVGKHIVSEYAEPLVATAFALVFGFIYVSILFHRHIPTDLRRTSSRRGFLWFGLSGIAGATGVTLLYLALNQEPVVVVSPLVAISPLVTLVLAGIFLRSLEHITRRTILGAVLVVSGVVIVAISNATS